METGRQVGGERGQIPGRVVAHVRLRPPLHDWIPRPCLSQALRTAFERRLTVVCAGPGYGKSTAVAQALSASALPSMWHSLAPEDTDPGLFLSYLVEGVAGLLPGFGAEIREEIAGEHREPSGLNETGNWGRICNLLSEEVRVTVVEPLVVVWDDFQQVEDATIIRSIVEQLLALLPPTIRFVLISRHDPPLSLARWEVQGQSGWFGESDLAFSGNELAALGRALGVELGDEMAATLAERTQGWVAPACLILPALRGLGQGARRDRIAGLEGSSRTLYTFLAEEAFERQTPEVQEFLLRSAIPDRFSAELMDRARETEGSDGLIEAVAQAHLFLTGAAGGWYRYHQLFRDFLRRGATRRLATTEKAVWHRRLGHALLLMGRQQEAVPHLLAANDHESALCALEGAAPGLLNTAALATMHGWVTALPPELAMSSVVVASVEGEALCRMGQTESAVPWLEEAALASGPLSPAQQRARDRATWLLMDALELLERAGDALARMAELEREGRMSPRLRAVAASAYADLGNFEAAGRMFERALADSGPGPIAEGAYIRNAYAANYLFRIGRHAGALEHAAWALEMQRRYDPSARIVNTMSVVAGVLELTGEPERAREMWRELRTTGITAGYSGYVEPLADQADGRLSLALGEPEAAAACASRCEQARNRPGAHPYGVCGLYLLQAGLALAGGDRAGARQHAELVVDQMAGSPCHDGDVNAAALIIGRCGEVARAIDALAPHLELVTQLGQVYWQAEGELIMAWLLRQRDDDAALAHLAGSLGLGARHGYWYLFARTRRDQFVDLLPHALSLQDADTGLLARILSDIGDATVPALERAMAARAALAAPVPNPGPILSAADAMHALGRLRGGTMPGRATGKAQRLPLRITTLGGFSVAYGDTTIGDRAWGRPKARTLVKYLLCQPGLAAPREVLYEALWPERPPGKAASNLWYTLSLARHALGANSSRSKGMQYIRVEGELCRFTLDTGDWWDAAAFRAAYDRARADGVPAGETAAAAWLAAEAAYGGPFLPGDLYEDWAAAPREELQERYLDVLWRLARYFGQQGEQEKALGRYLQMLAIDPLQEHVHRALMETFAAGGRRDRALRQYLLCRQMLESQLGVEPDAATAALYRQILG